jgi:hypothetical protein
MAGAVFTADSMVFHKNIFCHYDTVLDKMDISQDKGGPAYGIFVEISAAAGAFKSCCYGCHFKVLNII